jgi:hypothetical protein
MYESICRTCRNNKNFLCRIARGGLELIELSIQFEIITGIKADGGGSMGIKMFNIRCKDKSFAGEDKTGMSRRVARQVHNLNLSLPETDPLTIKMHAISRPEPVSHPIYLHIIKVFRAKDVTSQHLQKGIARGHISVVFFIEQKPGIRVLTVAKRVIHMAMTPQQYVYPLILKKIKVRFAGCGINQAVNFVLDKDAGTMREVAVWRVNQPNVFRQLFHGISPLQDAEKYTDS